MYRYMIRKNPYLLLYLIVSPLRSVSAIAVSGALSSAIHYAAGGSLGDVWKYVLAFTLYILIDFAMDASDQAARFHIMKHTMIALKSDVYHKVSQMCYLRFFASHSGELLSNMTTDTETIRGSYFSVILTLYSEFLNGLAALVVLMFVSSVLGFFVLITILIQAMVPLCFSKVLEQAGANYSNAQAANMRTLKENLSAFLTAKSFHIENPLERNYIYTLEKAEDARCRSKFLKEFSVSVSYVFNMVAQLGVFLIGAVLVIQNIISIAEVVASAELITSISYPILYLNTGLAELRTANVAIKKVQNLLNTPEDHGGSQDLSQQCGNICVSDLRFSYGDRQILSHVNCHFYAGKKYLIVGASGSGKSTFLTLLAGLRSDYQGEITINGVDIRKLTRASLARNLCMINQEPFLFDDTLYNNICLYEHIEEARVWNALERVELLPFAQNIGLHIPLGENASTMSGGEKQRVVIARALVRNTPVLLLDESTSHLDPNTAAEIEKLVLGLQDVTVLLISHNATQTAVQHCDEVLEMRDGMLQGAIG